MLSHEDNQQLCRVGPGTPMGQLMRQYWLPLCLASELPERDGAPLRVRLLSENLIAFRTTSGQVGLIRDACPHRGASLFFARNEEDGLRCVYHGWKFDTTGRCVDMPTEPPCSGFKTKVRAQTYPCVERGDVVWTYMGPQTPPPPLPHIEPNMLPEGQYQVGVALRECNWLQAMEGDLDTCHVGFLHLGGASAENLSPGSNAYQVAKNRAPQGYDVRDTEFGVSYGAYRHLENDRTYWRVAHFMFPFYTILPIADLGEQIAVRAWVPIDDEHTMFWEMKAPSTLGAAFGQYGDQAKAPGLTLDRDYMPQRGDWLERWRLLQNRDNDYLIDRAVQRSQSYSGIEGIFQQDAAVTESMGPIVDRTQEHLGTSDLMIIRTRRRLLRALAIMADADGRAPAADRPEAFAVRGGTVTLPTDAALWASIDPPNYRGDFSS